MLIYSPPANSLLCLHVFNMSFIDALRGAQQLAFSLLSFVVHIMPLFTFLLLVMHQTCYQGFHFKDHMHQLTCLFGQSYETSLHNLSLQKLTTMQKIQLVANCSCGVELLIQLQLHFLALTYTTSIPSFFSIIP